ncbi:LOW QUALITY PROTEIN: protein yippee-like 5 [Urocitellus parryii]
MSRIFLDLIGGMYLFSCANCDRILTNCSEFSSTGFTGATNRAFLFNKVVNLQYNEVHHGVMLPGCYMFLDVHCKNCNTTLAIEDSQYYKEGMLILEHALDEGFEELVPHDNS